MQGETAESSPLSKSETFLINRRVAALMATERKSMGMTQAALAKKMKKPQSFVSKCENGQRQMSIADLIGICKAFGVAPEDFIAKLKG